MIDAEAMLHAMTEQGCRITDQRRTFAELFASTDGYLSPKDVYAFMRSRYPGISFDTVYRNLRLLSELGILEQIYLLEGGLKFKASCLSHHHHHLICVNCEKTITFDYCPMREVDGLPEQFDILSHRFEIYGVCEACKA